MGLCVCVCVCVCVRACKRASERAHDTCTLPFIFLYDGRITAPRRTTQFLPIFTFAKSPRITVSGSTIVLVPCDATRSLTYHRTSMDACAAPGRPSNANTQAISDRAQLECGVANGSSNLSTLVHTGNPMPLQTYQGDITGTKEPRSVSEHGTLRRFHIVLAPATDAHKRWGGERIVCASEQAYTYAPPTTRRVHAPTASGTHGCSSSHACSGAQRGRCRVRTCPTPPCPHCVFARTAPSPDPAGRETPAERAESDDHDPSRRPPGQPGQ